MEQNTWEKCRTCGKPIAFGARYYTCSVSSCNRKSNPIVFCSVHCWDIHAPVMNHKNAGADENFAPSKSSSDISPERSPRKIIIPSSSTNSPRIIPNQESSQEILIVASKLKHYIRDKSDMNTSASVMDRLSEIVRELSDKAIDNARAEGRKTVLDRDFI